MSDAGPEMVEPAHAAPRWYCEECAREFQNRAAWNGHRLIKHEGFRPDGERATERSARAKIASIDKEVKRGPARPPKADRAPRPRPERAEPSLSELEEQLFELHGMAGWLLTVTGLPQTGYAMLAQARPAAHSLVVAAQQNRFVEEALRKVATGTVLALVGAAYLPVLRAFLVETGRVKIPVAPPEPPAASEAPTAPDGATLGEPAGDEYAYSAAPAGDGPAPY